MQIRSITASYSQKVPNPNEQYGNASFFLSVAADLDETDDAGLHARELYEVCKKEVKVQINNWLDELRSQASASRAERGTAASAEGLADKYRQPRS